MRQGPLKGLRVVEFAGIGPPTFCGMLFSDLGADVVRIDRPDARDRATPLITERGRRSMTLNLKHAQDVATALALLEKADMLIEGYRPTAGLGFSFGNREIGSRPAILERAIVDGMWDPFEGLKFRYATYKLIVGFAI